MEQKHLPSLAKLTVRGLDEAEISAIKGFPLDPKC